MPHRRTVAARGRSSNCVSLALRLTKAARARAPFRMKFESTRTGRLFCSRCKSREARPPLSFDHCLAQTHGTRRPEFLPAEARRVIRVRNARHGIASVEEYSQLDFRRRRHARAMVSRWRTEMCIGQAPEKGAFERPNEQVVGSTTLLF
jgi:hypothetical protein